MKRCSSCKIEKDFTEFYKVKTLKDGLSYTCKVCQKIARDLYKENNYERYYQRQKERRQTEDAFITQLVHGAKTRAKQKELDFSIDVDFIKKRLDKIKYRCEISGLLMNLESGSRSSKNGYKVSLDRRDSKQGYTKENVQLVCWALNHIKSNFDEHELSFWVNTLHKAISSQAPNGEGSTTIENTPEGGSE